MTQIFAFTGYPAAGKSAASTIAADAGHPVVEMGGVVRERATEALGPDATSSDIGNWATEHREHHGNDVFARYTADEVASHVEAGERVVVIDGLRTPTELAVFRERFDDVTLVLVTAPFESRLARMRERGREDEAEYTNADLRDRDQREGDWGLDDILEQGAYDLQVENDGTYDEFRSRIKTLLRGDD